METYLLTLVMLVGGNTTLYSAGPFDTEIECYDTIQEIIILESLEFDDLSVLHADCPVTKLELGGEN